MALPFRLSNSYGDCQFVKIKFREKIEDEKTEDRRQKTEDRRGVIWMGFVPEG
jgi:hypothetical protein